MRITSGQYRGRILKAPEGKTVRPTSDMVRQAVFNVLLQYGHPVDSVVIDAFSGTGALGLEALSRGARFCTFMDNNRTSMDFTKDNAAMLKIGAEALFLQKDATKPGPRPGVIAQADLVFLDPPYSKDLIIPALLALDENGWVGPSAVVVMESENHWQAAEHLPPYFEHLDTRSYGGTWIHMAQRSP